MSINIMDWMSGGDTGVSSLQIARRHLGLPLTDAFRGMPHDADDFGRCYRLLKKCPEIDINCMRGFNRIWDGLVDAWAELTAMYEAKNWKGIYDRINEIEKPYWKDHSMKGEDVLYS